MAPGFVISSFTFASAHWSAVSAGPRADDVEVRLLIVLRRGRDHDAAASRLVRRRAQVSAHEELTQTSTSTSKALASKVAHGTFEVAAAPPARAAARRGRQASPTSMSRGASSTPFRLRLALRPVLDFEGDCPVAPRGRALSPNAAPLSHGILRYRLLRSTDGLDAEAADRSAFITPSRSCAALTIDQRHRSEARAT